MAKVVSVSCLGEKNNGGGGGRQLKRVIRADTQTLRTHMTGASCDGCNMVHRRGVLLVATCGRAGGAGCQGRRRSSGREKLGQGLDILESMAWSCPDQETSHLPSSDLRQRGGQQAREDLDPIRRVRRSSEDIRKVIYQPLLETWTRGSRGVRKTSLVLRCGGGNLGGGFHTQGPDLQQGRHTHVRAADLSYELEPENISITLYVQRRNPRAAQPPWR